MKKIAAESSKKAHCWRGRRQRENEMCINMKNESNKIFVSLNKALEKWQGERCEKGPINESEKRINKHEKKKKRIIVVVVVPR